MKGFHWLSLLCISFLYLSSILALPTNDSKLIVLRYKIDRLDDCIYDFLCIRRVLCKKTILLKNSIHCSEREDNILERLKKKGILEERFIEVIWKNIFKQSKKDQEKEKKSPPIDNPFFFM